MPDIKPPSSAMPPPRTNDPSEKIVIAVNLVPFLDEQQVQRQAAAIAKISALSIPEIVLLNICYPDEILTPAGWHIAPLLQRSANVELNCDGKRKPFVPDLFDAAAEWAKDRGISWFVLTNSDIIFTEGLIAEIRRLQSEGIETVAISHNEIESENSSGTNSQGELIINGYAVFACRTSWWETNRCRFQQYIYGERAWDASFAAIMACHSRFTMLYVNGLCFHHKHPTSWLTGLYSDYNLNLYLGPDKPYSDRYRAFIQKINGLERSLLTPVMIEKLLAQYFSLPAAVSEQSPQKRRSEYFLKKAIALKSQGRYPEALDYLGHPEKVLELFCRSLESDPENLPALHEVVKLAYRMNRFDEAIHHTRQYLMYHPLDPDILFTLAGLFYKQGSLPEGMETVERLLLVAPDNEDASKLRERMLSETPE